MTKPTRNTQTDDAWDTGELGRDEEFVEIVQEDVNRAIDDSLELQMISIRLQKSLIEDFKLIAKMHGIGYQPLMRQILTRFADAEKKQLLRQVLREHGENNIDDDGDSDTPAAATG